jgi:hypothetical protein
MSFWRPGMPKNNQQSKNKRAFLRNSLLKTLALNKNIFAFLFSCGHYIQPQYCQFGGLIID